MHLDELKRAMRAQPFRSFTVHLADGRAIPVHHAEFIALSPTNRTFIVYQPNGDWDVIDTMLVTSLMFRVAEKPKRPRRRKAG
jgi:hypothetical protein